MSSQQAPSHCPYCNGSDLVRARRKGLAYHLRRRLTKARLYLCRECHRSFWHLRDQKQATKLRKMHRHSRPEPVSSEDILSGPERGLTSRQYAITLILSFLVAFMLILIFGKR